MTILIPEISDKNKNIIYLVTIIFTNLLIYIILNPSQNNFEFNDWAIFVLIISTILMIVSIWCILLFIENIFKGDDSIKLVVFLSLIILYIFIFFAMNFHKIELIAPGVTLVLVIITGYSISVTKQFGFKSLRAQEKAINAQNEAIKIQKESLDEQKRLKEPKIIANYSPDYKDYGNIYINISNVGKGVAKKVIIAFEPLDVYRFNVHSQKIPDIFVVHNLLPNSNVIIAKFNILGYIVLSKDDEPNLIVKIEYYDYNDNLLRDKFLFTLLDIKNLVETSKYLKDLQTE